MNRHRLFSWLCLLLVPTLALASTPALSLTTAPATTTTPTPATTPVTTPKQILRMGVLSYQPEATTRRQLQPLLNYINQHLDNQELTIQAMSLEEIDQALRFNQLEFVLTDPRHAMLLRSTNSLSGAIATMGNVNNRGDVIYSFGGVIFTRADRSDINSLTSPAIHSVALLSTRLLGDYQAPLVEFQEAGVDLRARASFTQMLSFDAVVSAVLSGRADIGFIRSGVLESMISDHTLKLDQLKILNRQVLPGFPFAVSTRLYPEWVVMAQPGVNTQTISRVASLLLSTYQLHGAYLFVSPADYSSVESSARRLHLPPFDVEPKVSWRYLWSQHRITIAFAMLSIVLLLATLVIAAIKNRQLNTRSATLRKLNTELEERVQARVRDIETIFNISPDAILQISDKGIITRLNDRALELFGYTQDDLLNQHIEKLVPLSEFSDQYEHFQQIYDNQLSKSGQSYGRNDAMMVTSKGKTLPVDVRISRLQGSAGLSIIATIRDITSQKQMEASLIKARDEAEQASRKKAEFLANMSHEIRTPMNGVLGMAELLGHANLDTEYRGYLDTLQQSGKTLLTVINDILDYSKITEGKLELEHIPFNFRDWVEALTLPYRLTQHKVEMITQVAEDVPEFIQGDATRLSQVFNNLLNNAFKFTDSGSVTFRIEVARRTAESAQLVFDVVDTGIGIADELKEKIFEQFEQADPSTTRKYGGTGLGLAISRQLVELSGGTISVHDNPGGGTRFQVSQSFTLAELVTESATNPDSQVSLGHLRVLLVEDNLVNQKVARAMLQKLGVSPVLANNGREAVECITRARERYDCIFMDCEMPLMDGYEATRRIRRWEQQEQRPRTTICALTAHAAGDQVQRCIHSGMDLHLSKPLQVARLEHCLQQITSIAETEVAATKSGRPS